MEAVTQPALRKSGMTPCEAMDDGWYCCLVHGHDGAHEAWTYAHPPRCVYTWPGEPR